MKDGDLLMLIIQPILQPHQVILQGMHQWPHLQLIDPKIHQVKSLPQYFDLPQLVSVLLELLDNVDESVDGVMIPLNHVS